MKLDITMAGKKIILTPENDAEQCQLDVFSSRFHHMVDSDFFEIELKTADWSVVEALEITAKYKAEE